MSASPFERQYAYFCEAEIERWLARQDELAMMADEEEAYEENEWLETLPEAYDHG